MKLKLLAVQSRLGKVNYSPTPVIEPTPPINTAIGQFAIHSARRCTPTFYQGSSLFLEN